MNYSTILKSRGYRKTVSDIDRVQFEKLHEKFVAIVELKLKSRKLFVIKTAVNPIYSIRPFTDESMNDYKFLVKDVEDIKSKLQKLYNIKEEQE